jgi:hypothetical protein
MQNYFLKALFSNLFTTLLWLTMVCGINIGQLVFADTFVFKGTQCQLTVTSISTGKLISVDSPPFSAVCDLPKSGSKSKNSTCTFIAPGAESVKKSMKLIDALVSYGGPMTLIDKDGLEQFRWVNGVFISQTIIDPPSAMALGTKACVGKVERKD